MATHLAVSVHTVETWSRVCIPKLNMTISSTTATCKNIWLPWTPSQSLHKKVHQLYRQSSPETQGQIVGARESLTGRKNMARRKVKNGEKSPWGQCLARPVPNGRCCSDFWLVPENVWVFLPDQKAERRRPFGTGLVRDCPQGLFSLFFTSLRVIFFRPFRLSLAGLSAHGSLRMVKRRP